MTYLLYISNIWQILTNFFKQYNDTTTKNVWVHWRSLTKKRTLTTCISNINKIIPDTSFEEIRRKNAFKMSTIRVFCSFRIANICLSSYICGSLSDEGYMLLSSACPIQKYNILLAYDLKWLFYIYLIFFYLIDNNHF